MKTRRNLGSGTSCGHDASDQDTGGLEIGGQEIGRQDTSMQ
jgi:hypothetical protein